MGTATFWFWVFMPIFVFFCAIMILLVLIQKGRGGGLSGAFGGSGGNTAFGTKTGDVLTWATSIVFAIFVFLAVAMNLSAEYERKHSANAVVPIVVPTAPVTPPSH